MSPRDTRTGGVLEAMILPSLIQGGYTFEPQVRIGQRPGGGNHFVDLVAYKEGRSFLISLKWQQTAGTAEQKVPFEVICLTESIIEGGKYSKAYLVLGGDGWKLRDFYTSGELQKYLEYKDKVDIVTLEQFVAIANQGKL